MNRKLILPALAALALLAGCATGYQYRGGSGDYYYGSPSVEYRVYGSYGYPGYYGYGYPYGGYGYGYYGYPYGYGGGYYYYPRHRRGHWHGGHDGDHDHDDGNDGGSQNDRPTPPWRDLGSIGDRGRHADPGDGMAPRRGMAPIARPGGQPHVPMAPRSSAPRPGSARPGGRPGAIAPSVPRRSGGSDGGTSGSRLSEMLQRSQQ